MNRIDDIIVFQKLTQEEIQQIAVHMLNDLKARLEPLGVSWNLPRRRCGRLRKRALTQYMAPVRCGGKFKLRWRIL